MKPTASSSCKDSITVQQARCPVCGNETRKEIFDICGVCFWEHDFSQESNPNDTEGANRLSLNNYIKLWRKLNDLMPRYISKYEITKGKGYGEWTYSCLSVPRKYINEFIDELTAHNIPINLNYYNICLEKHLKVSDFHGYPYIASKSVKENNLKAVEIIFSEDPLKTCEQYNLIQLTKLLKKSENIKQEWERLTPLIDIDMQWRIEDLGGTI